MAYREFKRMIREGIACSLPITTHRGKSLRSGQDLKTSTIVAMILFR
jgi:hypothetical protein